MTLLHGGGGEGGACAPAGWEAGGGWLLEAALVGYIFWGFYLVTDVFFLPAISVLVERLHIPDDLAGATVLGAALNSPELFSNLIGIFVLKNPVGLGLVMGSFNFNILCITGFTALCSRQRLRSRQLKLEWRYLQRDAGFYLLSVLLLVAVSSDQQLEAWECFSLLGLYAAYVGICVMTGHIARLCCGADRKPRRKRPLGNIILEALGEGWLEAQGLLCLQRQQAGAAGLPQHAASSPLHAGGVPDVEQPLLPSPPAAGDEEEEEEEDGGEEAPASARTEQQRAESAHELLKILRSVLDSGYSNLHTRSRRSSFDSQGNRELSAPRRAASDPGNGALASAAAAAEVPQLSVWRDRSSWQALAEEERERNWNLVEQTLLQGSPEEINCLLSADARLIAVAIDTFSHEKFASDVMELAKDVEADQAHAHEDLLAWPKEGSWHAKACFIVTWPLTAILRMTMSHKPSLYLPTIAMAVLWLAVLAYGLDWAAGRVGCSIGLDDELIGITVVAIGTSLPNVFAAVVAGSKGQVETSISQAFGSNIFDILIAFGLPYTLLLATNGWQPVHVPAANISTDGLIDLGVLALYLALLFYFRMRLTKVQGAICLVLYVCYLVYEVVDFLYLDDNKPLRLSRSSVAI